MANLATTMGIGVVLSFMAQGLGSIRAAERGLQSLINASGQFKQMATFAGLALASVLALTAGISALHGVMANAQVYADYEHELAKLAGLLDQPLEEMGMYNEEAMRLASTSRSTAQEIATGMYEIASAGYQGEDIISMLNASILLADTRELSMSEASSTLTKVLHGFAIPAEQATDTLDKLGKAVAITQLHFGDLEEGFGTFGMTAHAAGQSLEDMLALYGAFVTSGLSPSRSAMMVKMMTTTLMGMTPTAKTFMDSLGVEYIDAATGQMRPLIDIIGEVQEALEIGTLAGTEFEAAFGEIPDDIAEAEAMYKGLVALFGRRAVGGYFAAAGYMFETVDATWMGVDALREMSSEIANSEGFMERYHDTVMNTMNAQMDVIKSNIDLLKLQIGAGLVTALKPVLEFVVSALQSITGFLAAHPEVAAAIGMTSAILAAAITAGGIILSIAAVMAGLAIRFTVPIAAFGTHFATFGRLLGAVFSRALPILGVIGIVIAAIALAVAAVARYWDAFKAAFDPLVSALGRILTPMITTIQTIIEPLAPVLKGILDVLLAIIAAVLFIAAFVTVGIIGMLFIQLRLIYNVIATVIGAIITVFTGDWEGFGNYLENLWGGLWTDFVGMLNGIWDAIVAFFTNLWNKIQEFLGLTNLSFSGGPSSGETSAEWAASRRGAFIHDSPPELAIGAYSVPHDQWAFLHEGEDVTQRGQSPYSGGSIGNTFNISGMQLQVVSSGNESYDADRLYNQFIARMRRESERVM
jgi:hypothetical protein